jgi:hypothetical protein
LLFLSIFAGFLALSPRLATTSATVSQGGDRITFAIDETIRPARTHLPGLDREAPARPLASLIGPKGRQVDFVYNELTLVTDDSAALDAFVARWGAEVVKSLNPAEYRLTGARQHLVRIDPSRGNDASLLTDLQALAPRGARGHHRVSSRDGLNLLAIAAREAVGGMMVGVNWVGKSDGFIDRTTAESPNGPSADQMTDKISCCPNEFGPGGYSPNAFDWNHLDEAPGPGFGVTEAWRMLALAGKLGNKVDIAILDQGFLPNDDFPTGGVAWSVGAFDPIGTIGLDDEWHGTKVVGAGMALPNNGFGAAGPGGPVAVPILIYTSYDPWTSTVALMNAVAFGADIINMSYHWEVPATLSFTVLPFSATTGLIREGGVLIFASAGNSGDDVDEEDCFIACWEEEWYAPCENAGVTCVGGLGAGSIWLAGNSNFGTDGDVDIFAPYTVLVGPDGAPNSNIAQIKSGTSYSSPYMAGVAALVWAANPGLDADQVESAIIAASKTDSPDDNVSRYVNASGAVHSVLGNVPPAVKIVKPANGATVDAGGFNFVTFEASPDDYEDGNSCCAVTWSSNKDGVMGQGEQIQFTFSTNGSRTVTATVTDSQGATNKTSIIVNVGNTAPTVSIKKPTPGQTLYTGITYVFDGSSFDPNEPLFTLPCSSLKWTSNKAGDPLPVTGCAPSVSFPTPGFRNITLTGTDPQGATDTASVLIIVANPPANSPPIVTILKPNTSDFLDPYVSIVMSGKADDPDNKSPLTYEWKLQDGSKWTTLGTGTMNDGQTIMKFWKPANNVPFNCGGRTVRLYLYATDPDGQTGWDYVDVYIGHPAC